MACFILHFLKKAVSFVYQYKKLPEFSCMEGKFGQFKIEKRLCSQKLKESYYIVQKSEDMKHNHLNMEWNNKTLPKSD